MSLTINTCELAIMPPAKALVADLWHVFPSKRPRHHTVNLRRHKNNPARRVCLNDAIGIRARSVDCPSIGCDKSSAFSKLPHREARSSKPSVLRYNPLPYL